MSRLSSPGIVSLSTSEQGKLAFRHGLPSSLRSAHQTR